MQPFAAQVLAVLLDKRARIEMTWTSRGKVCALFGSVKAPGSSRTSSGAHSMIPHINTDQTQHPHRRRP